MKGIILAAGKGTRLYPLTLVTPKPLIPVYDKPMIYYPLMVLMVSGITEFLVITTPRDQVQFRLLLGDGSQWGISIEYAVQPTPQGIAQAYSIASDFLAGSPSALILGDNLFHGLGLEELLSPGQLKREGAKIFVYRVDEPEQYGVVDFAADGRVVAIEEKPRVPPSNWAVTGLYFCDEQVIDIVANLDPSERGELEIADVIRAYLKRGQLDVKRLGNGFSWFDMGTPDTLFEASAFVRTVQKRETVCLASPEEVALSRGLIDHQGLLALALEMEESAYGQYLLKAAYAGM